jgi:mediator of RNA polymerase II transcription subunit 12
MVWNPLKHKSGLHILSSLYISIIDKRLVHASTPPKCTFKPPPRVTLPDTKREAWLRDLAKPTTALRRLSRTIPHGIRGKALLDHCLAKRIPIRRAVWLAKCVGANEIRAFKRKGSAGAFSAGGESKWIKDWTSNVEHFLEALMMPFHPLDWIVHLAYGYGHSFIS